ncbi:MAG: tryptophan--tRNA ligase, partial [Candidatus Delongbacteria bacterium]|nr:tryptophan--tRNA ligase [Candidatus Delongbacteria bacterium]
EGDEKAGVRNLLTIYSNLSDLSIEELQNKYVGKGYGDFKKDLAEVVVETLKPIREKHDELMNNKDYLNEVLKKCTEYAQKKAWKTMSKVYRKVGLVPPAR